MLAPAANSNTDKTIAIGTSVGFRTLAAADYADGVEGLGADIVVGLGDIPYGRTPGNKRIEKATDRSIAWLQDHVLLRKEKEAKHQAKLFASLLPVSCAEQQYYIDKIEELVDDVSGLAIHDTSSLEGLPEDLWHLPRLGYTEPASPHDILRQVGLGIDIFAVPFITAATDAGIALDFSFPSKQEATSNGREPSALGIDMWLPTHAVDVSPLSAECECYACTNHHRAYLQHLLAAKEMLGWVLLQIHNHHVIELVFEGIRSSIAAGTFEDDVTGFSNVYESSLPEKTGQGPRYVTIHCEVAFDTDRSTEYEATNSKRKGQENQRRTKLRTAHSMMRKRSSLRPHHRAEMKQWLAPMGSKLKALLRSKNDMNPYDSHCYLG